MADEKKPGFRRLTQRKFLMPVIATLLLATTEAVGISLTDKVIDSMVILVLGFMGVEGLKDGVAAWKNGNGAPPSA